MNYLCMNNSNMNDSSFNRKKQLFLVVKTFKKFTCDNNNLQKKRKKVKIEKEIQQMTLLNFVPTVNSQFSPCSFCQTLDNNKW